MNNVYKVTLEVSAYAFLLLGSAIAISAIGQYNHGNISYAIYAVGSATFCGTVAIAFSIMRASN